MKSFGSRLRQFVDMPGSAMTLPCGPLARAAVLILTLTGMGLIALLAAGELCISEWRAAASQNLLLSVGVLFVWSLILFLTVLPLGTATIILAGAAIGGWVGWVQFASLVIASQILFEISDGGRLRKALAFIGERPRLRRLLAAIECRGLALTIALRIAPVVPSAVCSLAAAGLSVSRTKFLLGTLSAGWLRPVAFADAGALVAATVF